MKIKTSIVFNIISVCFCIFSITFGVYSLTQAQINISGFLGYEKHKSQVTFVKDDTYESSGYGTIEYQINEDGVWINLIQDGELLSSISDVTKIQFKITGVSMRRFVSHYMFTYKETEYYGLGNWPTNEETGSYETIVTSDIFDISGVAVFTIGCHIAS